MTTKPVYQKIEKLDPRRGGYHYIYVDASVVEKLTAEKKPRLLCTIDGWFEFQCGLNHMGDGNFYIILSGKRIKELKKQEGDEVSFVLGMDPDPLGAEIPEVMQVLLDQDEDLLKRFLSMTDGKKRGVIHYISSTKNIDLQVKRTVEMLEKYGKIDPSG